MSRRYAQIAFTEAVRRHQETYGSRRSYARMEAGPRDPDALGPVEQAFIAERDSFYLASVGQTGWPYVQHRGGPPGFLRVLEPRTLAFADRRGNRQYITTGNLDDNDRVALFLMDYPHQARLKIFGRATAVTGDRMADIARRMTGDGIDRHVERIMLIEVHAYDWNCQQYITPRFTIDEVEVAVRPLRERLAALEAENRDLRARLAAQNGALAGHGTDGSPGAVG